MQLRRTLLRTHFSKIVETIFTKIKSGSFQKPDSIYLFRHEGPWGPCNKAGLLKYDHVPSLV